MERKNSDMLTVHLQRGSVQSSCGLGHRAVWVLLKVSGGSELDARLHSRTGYQAVTDWK
jgi:hypothetical protein